MTQKLDPPEPRQIDIAIAAEGDVPAIDLPLRQARSGIFFSAMRASRMPMIVTDPHLPDNPIVFSNAAFARLSGYDEAEILGTNCRFLQGPDTDRAVVAQVRDAIAERREVSVELVNYRKDGTRFWNALFVSPVFDDDGALVYFFASQFDASRRREAEAALNQANKMEAVGQLTGGIAHDFNNLLQVIIGYSDMLEARIDGGDRAAQRAVEAIGAAAQRGATLTQQLLAFARKQELRDRLLDFNALVADFGADLDSAAGEGMVLRRDLAPDLWPCRVDPVQAEMALVNILANARDAAGGLGEVVLATRNISVRGNDGVAAGDYVLVEIHDHGPGIAPAVIERIFDPFFSTKARGKGTGLGLAMVYGFLRQSGGMVRAINRDDGGATVSLYFPRAFGVVEAAPPAARAAPGPLPRRRVLMVEDQGDVASLGQAMLVDLGYDVTRAADAAAALAVLTADAGFDLLFSDIIMPGGMNGVELAQAVRRDHPAIRVLLTSGYSDDAIGEDGRGFALLRKPYRAADLAARVRAILESPGAV